MKTEPKNYPITLIGDPDHAEKQAELVANLKSGKGWRLADCVKADESSFPPMTADDLAEIIASTNNGYLFAPTGEQIKVARENPDRFITGYGNETFPYRISVRGGGEP